jgi:predicted enzyme related to lactoylglutathione lyase
VLRGPVSAWYPLRQMESAASLGNSGGRGHVTVYVEVDDLAAYLSKAERLGGKTVVPPTEISEFSLSFAFFADPEGHVVGLSKGVIQ